MNEKEREQAVRELAEEIAGDKYPTARRGDPRLGVCALHWEGKLTAFLAEREEELEGQLTALREILEAVDQICRDSFRDAGTVESHRTVPVCPLCSGEAVCDEECPAPDIRRALATNAGKGK